MSLNSWCFTGRLGKDSETRSTNSGDKVTSWSVAVDIGYGDKKETMWVDCQMWGARGEKLSQHLRKGQEVAVSGAAWLRSWESNGTARTTLTCRVSDVALVGGKGDRQSASAETQIARRAPPPMSDLDVSIPF